MPPKPGWTGRWEGRAWSAGPSDRKAASMCNASRFPTMAREFPPRTCPRSFVRFPQPKLRERGWALPWSRKSLSSMAGRSKSAISLRAGPSLSFGYLCTGKPPRQLIRPIAASKLSEGASPVRSRRESAMTKGIVLAPIVGVFALSLLSMPGWTRPSPQSQDSVAEAARKAREQKKAPAKPAKVVTNDDLSSAASAQVSVVGQAESKGAAGTPGDKRKKAPGGEGEEKPAESEGRQWRKRFGAAYHRLHQAEAELDVLQREWGKIQSQ